MLSYWRKKQRWPRLKLSYPNFKQVVAANNMKEVQGRERAIKELQESIDGFEQDLDDYRQELQRRQNPPAREGCWTSSAEPRPHEPPAKITAGCSSRTEIRRSRHNMDQCFHQHIRSLIIAFITIGR